MTESIIPTAAPAQRLAALLAGKRGELEFDRRLYRSNVSGEELEEITTIDAATVSLSNYRDHTWELALTAREARNVNVFTDYVKLVVCLRDPGGPEEWLKFPRGLYRFDAPRGVNRPTGTDWGLVGRSLESLLLGDGVSKVYTVPAGTGILARVRQILIANGVPADRIRFPPGDKALVTPMVFDPYQDAEACRWLRICNALLAAGGFYALFCDAEGYFLTGEIEDFEDRRPDVVYGSESGSERLIGDANGDTYVNFEYDDERFGNQVVVYSGDFNQSPPRVAIAELRSVRPANPPTNTVYVIDPDSTVTIEALAKNGGSGVRRTEDVVLQNLVSQIEAERLARRSLQIAAGFDLKLSFPTVQDPRRGPREVYGLDLVTDAGTRVYGETFRVIGWTEPQDDSEMTHEISRAVRP